MAQKLNILIIANKVAFPTLDGGALAIKSLTEVLTLTKNNIDLVAIQKNNNLSKSTTKPIIEQRKNGLRQIVFEKNMTINLSNIIRSFIDKTSYQATRFYDKEIANFIQDLINKFKYKFIIFESIFTTVYLQKIKFKRDTKIIFRAHNIEHKIWLDLSKNNIIKQVLYNILSNQIKRMEIETPKHVDYVLTLSDFDFNYFNNLYPTKTLNFPVTFNVQKNIKQTKIKNSIVHLGAMDWQPNIEGINWFLENIKPNIEKSGKNIKIFIAGKNMPNKYFKHKNTSTIIQGKVENSQAYISDKTILFVPIFSGSGIRIKILEAMSLGVPVVSTTKGAKGIPCINKKNILIANTPNEFENAIYTLLKNKELREKIVENGKILVKKNYSNNVALKKWKQILK